MKKSDKAKQKKGSKDEINELKNQLARSLADYDNLRKRIEKEKELLEGFISARVVTRMLPIFDMLTEAQKHLNDQGVAMVLTEFEKTLKDEGIGKIGIDKGEKFDENIHEALETIAGGKKGTIAEEVVTGWKLSRNGQVIKPAKVKVYK